MMPAPLTKEETNALRSLFALLGDGREKVGREVRAYLDGDARALQGQPAIRERLDAITIIIHRGNRVRDREVV